MRGGVGPLPSDFTLCEVEMFTTASSRGAARSATDAGPFVCAIALPGTVIAPAIKANPATAAMPLRSGDRVVTGIQRPRILQTWS